MLYSFSQLFAHTVFGMELPNNDKDGFCRECAGPIAAGTGIEKDYGDSWVDEGLLPYSQGKYVCPACIEVAKGSTTRTLMAPGLGQVLIVGIGDSVPAPARLQLGYDLDKARGIAEGGIKNYIHEGAWSLLEFLEKADQIKPPYGVVIGAGGKNDRHFIRSVPVNYLNRNVIMGLIVPGNVAVMFRKDVILESFIDCKKQYEEQVAAKRRVTQRERKSIRETVLEESVIKRKMPPDEANILKLLGRLNIDYQKP